MFRSSAARAWASTSVISSTATRQAIRAPRLACQQSRQQSTHAISNPTLANIEKRWEQMPPQEQADLWMALRDRMTVDWKDMTMAEKKAAYWIAFGPHGPRALPPPGEGKKVALYTAIGVLTSFTIFFITRQFARPPPKTMTKEWQEASEEFMKNQGSEPITGYPGMLVQSKPEKK